MPSPHPVGSVGGKRNVFIDPPRPSAPFSGIQYVSVPVKMLDLRAGKQHVVIHDHEVLPDWENNDRMCLRRACSDPSDESTKGKIGRRKRSRGNTRNEANNTLQPHEEAGHDIAAEPIRVTFLQSLQTDISFYPQAVFCCL
jgi:hypothetical protein